MKPAVRFTYYITGSDPAHACITALLEPTGEPETLGQLMQLHTEGKADDRFDITLYGNPEGTDEEKAWYKESTAALRELLDAANAGLSQGSRPDVDPPEHLADAWRRYQAGEDVTPDELRKLDEWRIDCAVDF